MNVSVIGSGNVAAVLGRLMKDAGHTIDAVVSRNTITGEALAFELQTINVKHISGITAQSDAYIIAVSDAGIAAVANELRITDALLMHTSGAVSKEVLKPAAEQYGVLYPLQSLRKELKTIPVIPFLVDASSEKTLARIETFAESLSGIVRRAGDAERLKMHLAAVIVSNFTNHLYALADRYCQTEALDFDLLHPIIKEVADRLQFDAPENMQTGPALRSDQGSIDKHLGLLENHGALKNIYEVLTESIQQFYRR